jgi:hypothetical protein
MPAPLCANIFNKRHADENPKSGTLFRDISTYILNQTSQSSIEPVLKKRKLEDSNNEQNGSAGGNLFSAEAKVWRSYPGVSFSLPQRKKFTLELVLDKKEGGIRSVGADGKVEFGIAWKDVGELLLRYVRLPGATSYTNELRQTKYSASQSPRKRSDSTISWYSLSMVMALTLCPTTSNPLRQSQ